jgi:hypothetical protein
MPIYVTKVGSRYRVWGGVRPGAGDSVAIQTGSGSSWKTVKTVRVNRYGYIDQKIAKPRGSVRLLWKSPDGQDLTSRVAKVDKP